MLTEGLRVARGDVHTAPLSEDIAVHFAEREDGERSLEAAERAVGLAPDRVRANYLRGRALALVGRLPDAREQMRRVLQLDADNADALRAIRMLDDALGGP